MENFEGLAKCYLALTLKRGADLVLSFPLFGRGLALTPLN